MFPEGLEVTLIEGVRAALSESNSWRNEWGEAGLAYPAPPTKAQPFPTDPLILGYIVLGRPLGPILPRAVSGGLAARGNQDPGCAPHPGSNI